MANPFPFASSDVLTAAELNSIGEWTTYTPTLNNISGSIVTARYAQINETVHVYVNLQVTAVTNYFDISLPVTAANLAQLNGGWVYFYDVGANIYWGMTLAYTTTAVRFSPFYLSGSYASYTTANTNTPFTWASGDYIYFGLTYEAA